MKIDTNVCTIITFGLLDFIGYTPYTICSIQSTMIIILNKYQTIAPVMLT